MMIKKLFLPLFALILAFGATSCLGNNDDQSNTQQVKVSCYNKIAHDGDDKVTISSANYVFEFDFIANKVSVTSFDTNINAVSYTLKDLPLSISADKGYTIASSAPKVTDAQGKDLAGVTITDFYCQVADITDATGTFKGTTFKLTYRVDGNTTVYASLIEDLFANNSVTRITGTTTPSDVFEWKEATYHFIYTLTEPKAKLIISNIRFSEKMPTTITEMVVDGLEITPTVNGLKLSAKEVTPTIAGVEYPAYKFSNIEAVITPGFNPSKYFLNERMDLTFNCMTYSVVASATTYKGE